MTQFEAQSWVTQGQRVGGVGANFQSQMTAAIGRLNPGSVGADHGSTIADACLAGLLPAIPDALLEMVNGIQFSLEATSELMRDTGQLYADTEDANTANAVLLQSIGD